METMSDKCAAVLRVIVRNPDKTKLYLKQTTGYSMTTVLDAVNKLEALGWIRVESVSQPCGKAHAKISPSARPISGAAVCENGWECCRLRLDNLLSPQFERSEAKPQLPSPCSFDANTPLSRACLTGMRARQDVFAYLDDPEHILVMPEGRLLSVEALPSPYWRGRRLTYREAWGTPALRRDLARDLAENARVWLGVPVYTVFDLPALPLSAFAAYRAAWDVLHAPIRSSTWF